MKSKTYLLITILGLLLMGFGGYSVKSFELSTTLEIIAYLAVGVGSGIFGSGIGWYIKKMLISKDPQMAKDFRVEENDERNIAIVRTAKSQAFSLMNYLYGGMFLAFAIMKIDSKYLLVMVIFYLMVNVYAVIASNSLRKKM